MNDGTMLNAADLIYKYEKYKGRTCTFASGVT